ncbi:hypothetical protein BC938DRAFT_477815, partial [Jimgerdemannia flammicorona]
PHPQHSYNDAHADRLVEDPLSDEFYDCCTSTARRSTEAFRKVFRSVPDSGDATSSIPPPTNQFPTGTITRNGSRPTFSQPRRQHRSQRVGDSRDAEHDSRPLCRVPVPVPQHGSPSWAKSLT